jgi:hypothetical protein
LKKSFRIERDWWCNRVQHAKKHDIDLIIEIELKKLYAALTELGYKLTLSEKAKLYCRKRFW